MTRDEQDEAFATYATNLQASMNRHPAGSPFDTPKIKAKGCTVLHEVDIDGRPIKATP